MIAEHRVITLNKIVSPGLADAAERLMGEQYLEGFDLVAAYPVHPAWVEEHGYSGGTSYEPTMHYVFRKVSG